MKAANHHNMKNRHTYIICNARNEYNRTIKSIRQNYFEKYPMKSFAE
jgi:hypothetical protein